MAEVLLQFNHGLGDAVQFTAVLKHLRRYRPEWTVDVAGVRGKQSAWNGLCRRAYHDGEARPADEAYDRVLGISWWENFNGYRDRPNSKITNCLKEVFAIDYDPLLARYNVEVPDSAYVAAASYLESIGCRPGSDGRYNAAILHYQGYCASERKNLSHAQARIVLDIFKDEGCIPIVLDWDKWSPWPDQREIFNPPIGPNDLWGGFGSGDAAAICALISKSTCFVGIDSGPAKCASATETPSLIIWTKHHPVQFYDPSPNTLHLVPLDHQTIGPARDPDIARYFQEHYFHSLYDSLPSACRRVIPRLVHDRSAISQGVAATASPTARWAADQAIERRWLQFDGHLKPADGYGMCSVLWLRQFKDLVHLSPGARERYSSVGTLKFDPSLATLYAEAPPLRTSWALYFASPMDPCCNADHHAIWTMWEADVLPRAWRHALERFDLVIVPDVSQIDIFRGSGVSAEKLRIAPGFVDFGSWPPALPRQPDGCVKFLTWGVLGARKSPDLVIEAFRRAFQNDENVSLTLKTIDGWRAFSCDDPRVHCIDREYSVAELRHLATEHDCCVFISRGEGFGTCPLQAAAVGRPVILNAALALRSQWDESCNYPVEDLGNEPCTDPHLSGFVGGDPGNWARVDVDRVAERMREIYERREDSSAKGWLAALQVRRKFGSQAVRKQWEPILAEMQLS